MAGLTIQFFDNDGYDYPLIEIDKKHEKEFKRILKNYQKREEYNFDDFLIVLNDKGIKTKVYKQDIELYF